MSEGRFAEARQRATRLIADAVNPSALENAALHHLLGLAGIRLGLYGEAETAFRKALDLCQAAASPNSELQVTVLAALSEAQVNQAHFDEGEQSLRQASDLASRDLPPDHPRLAEVWDRWGLLHLARGRPARAEAAIRRSIAILEQRFGPDHDTVVTELDTLAVLLTSMGRHAEAIPILERGAGALGTRLGARHPHSIVAQYSLGAALLETAPERAERVLREGLANWLATQPERHPQTAMLLNALAKARYRRRDITEAVALNDRALDIALAVMGPQHPVVVMQMLDRADFLVAANRRKEAAALRKEANRIRTAKGYGEPNPHSIDINALRGWR